MKKLFNYSFFLFLEKGLAFILPLSILYLTKDEGLYVNLEAALAFSILLIPLLDMGIKNYVGYMYTRKGNDCFEQFDLLSLQVIITNLIIAVPLYLYSDFLFIYVMAILRALHINLFQYLQIKGRLTEKLIPPLIISIFASVISILLAISLFYLGVANNTVLLGYFILPPSIFLLYHLSQNKPYNSSVLKINFSDQLYFSMLKFSIPLMMNSLLVVGFANLTKIYVLNSFGQAEMVKYSFDFRVAMIIQFVHMAVVGYITKFLLTSHDFVKMIKVYFYYISSLVGCLVLTLLTIHFLGLLVNPKLLVVDSLLLIIFGYTILWCLSAFFDVLYIRMNKTSLLLINSIIFFISYILFYFFHGILGSVDAALGLLFSAGMMLTSNIFIIFYNFKHLKKSVVND
tara:strand:- start:258 stop:1457 length:1200 start_codon:yes stop_codon:yes gene_type:complete